MRGARGVGGFGVNSYFHSSQKSERKKPSGRRKSRKEVSTQLGFC
jgi:hypothetical protein